MGSFFSQISRSRTRQQESSHDTSIETHLPPELSAALPAKNVVGVGDNHGCNPEFLKHDLMRIGAMTLDGHFSRQFDGVLVQMGDIFDRGEHAVEIFHLWRTLQTEAASQVIRECGNHDLYHMAGAPWVVRGDPAPGVQELLLDDVRTGKIVAAWGERDVLYTHAGLDLEFFPKYREKPLAFVVEDLNRRFRTAAAAMRPGDEEHNLAVLDSDPIFSDHGIFWTRANISNDQFRQVVGHTPQVNGIQDQPGTRVKYIDAGRIFGEEGTPLERLRARAFAFNTVARGNW